MNKAKKKSRRKAETRAGNKVRLTVALVTVLVAAAAAATVHFVSVRMNQSVALPNLYSVSEIDYQNEDDRAQRSRDSFGSDLCVSSEDVANSAVSLQGEETGALFSLDDQTVMYSRNMFEQVYPASITKIMTAIVAMKYGDMDEVVTINWQDLELESGATVCGFQIGDQVTMSELMRGLLVHSGNDAAKAIARTVAGSEDAFVEMMNEELTAIGATGSHFTNASGLHDDNHYTTVYDIYLMFHEALKYDLFTNIMQVSVYDLTYTDASGEEAHVNLDSTDQYLTGVYDPPANVTVLGGKTGTTDEAGSCLCIESQNAYGQPYVSIILGAATKDALYTDMSGLLSLIND